VSTINANDVYDVTFATGTELFKIYNPHSSIHSSSDEIYPSNKTPVVASCILFLIPETEAVSFIPIFFLRLQKSFALWFWMRIIHSFSAHKIQHHNIQIAFTILYLHYFMVGIKYFSTEQQEATLNHYTFITMSFKEKKFFIFLSPSQIHYPFRCATQVSGRYIVRCT
jgi:hypothetical protein